MKEKFIKYIKPISIGLGLIFILWLFCFNYLNYHEVSLNKNLFTSEVTCDTIPGFKISAPWIQVSQIDTRPIKVCIDCSCRNLNCKLVSFNPKGYKQFLEKEGWQYYWFRNRFSFNYGNKEEWRGIRNVIRGYAFDYQKYEFLKYHE